MKRNTRRINALGLILVFSLLSTGPLSAGCYNNCPPCPFPIGGVYATFQVGASEIFRASITNPTGIDQALALWQGTSQAGIPNGSLVCQPVAWNCGWSWHLDPDSVEFAEVTIELCDGTPSYIEANCQSFGERYCPWAARLIELRDCREDPECPIVPR